MTSFRHANRRNQTELSKYIWTLKDAKKPFRVQWKVLATCKPYDNVSKKCNLCLKENFFIICIIFLLCIINNYSKNARWIRALDSGRYAEHRVCYHTLISNRRERNNCFVKYQTLDKIISNLIFYRFSTDSNFQSF